MSVLPDLLPTVRLAEVQELNRIAANLGHAALDALGVPVRPALVSGRDREPVAVHIENFYDSDEANWQGVDGINFDQDAANLRSLFPLAGALLLPSNVRRMIDLVVQASMDNHDILATQITSEYAKRTAKDTYRHFDHPDKSAQFRALNGLNIHLNTQGVAQVELAGIPSRSAMTEFERAVEAEDYEKARRVLPYWAALELKPGDVLIFRGGPDETRALRPTAHLFITNSKHGQRVREIFIPSYDEAARVALLRQMFAGRYALAA